MRLAVTLHQVKNPLWIPILNRMPTTHCAVRSVYRRNTGSGWIYTLVVDWETLLLNRALDYKENPILKTIWSHIRSEIQDYLGEEIWRYTREERNLMLGASTAYEEVI